jgi:hypothetical protein
MCRHRRWLRESEAGGAAKSIAGGHFRERHRGGHPANDLGGVANSVAGAIAAIVVLIILLRVWA